MPAIASFEDLKAAQKDLQEAKDLNELGRTADKHRKKMSGQTTHLRGISTQYESIG
jgi:hypothetical protein